jgi:hypothetical protein
MESLMRFLPFAKSLDQRLDDGRAAYRVDRIPVALPSCIRRVVEPVDQYLVNGRAGHQLEAPPEARRLPGPATDRQGHHAGEPRPCRPLDLSGRSGSPRLSRPDGRSNSHRSCACRPARRSPPNGSTRHFVPPRRRARVRGRRAVLAEARRTCQGQPPVPPDISVVDRSAIRRLLADMRYAPKAGVLTLVDEKCVNRL